MTIIKHIFQMKGLYAGSTTSCALQASKTENLWKYFIQYCIITTAVMFVN